MWEQGEIANYHTKNGVIMARKSKELKYVPIRPDMTRAEIIAVTGDASPKTQQNQNQNLLKSQTLNNIPSGRVANQRADLEQMATITTRSGGRGGQNRGRGRGAGNQY